MPSFVTIPRLFLPCSSLDAWSWTTDLPRLPGFQVSTFAFDTTLQVAGLTCIISMRDDPLCLRPSLHHSIAYLKYCPCCSDFSNLLPSLATIAQKPCFLLSSRHQPTMADMFASRKRGREDGEDYLQHFAPDTKVSAVKSTHEDRGAD